jgi:hypothetical protein
MFRALTSGSVAPQRAQQRRQGVYANVSACAGVRTLSQHRSTSACASAAAAGAGESGVIASTAAPEQQPPQQQQHKPAGSIDWAAKRRKRLVEDLSQVQPHASKAAP